MKITFRKVLIAIAVVVLLAIVIWLYAVKNPARADNDKLCYYYNYQGCHQYWSHRCIYNGGCSTPTPTPTPEPTPTPIQECEDCITPTPTPEPTATPEATPTPVVQDHSGPYGAPQCVDEAPQFKPEVTKAWRDGKGNVDVTWTKTDPVNQYIVYFGLSGKNLDWNTGRVPGWETTLHQTPNELLDVQVCAVSSCGQLNCSTRFIDP
jgi:hypothetical protein